MKICKLIGIINCKPLRHPLSPTAVGGGGLPLRRGLGRCHSPRPRARGRGGGRPRGSPDPAGRREPALGLRAGARVLPAALRGGQRFPQRLGPARARGRGLGVSALVERFGWSGAESIG